MAHRLQTGATEEGHRERTGWKPIPHEQRCGTKSAVTGRWVFVRPADGAGIKRTVLALAPRPLAAVADRAVKACPGTACAEIVLQCFSRKARERRKKCSRLRREGVKWWREAGIREAKKSGERRKKKQREDPALVAVGGTLVRVWFGCAMRTERNQRRRFPSGSSPWASFPCRVGKT